MKKIAVCLTIAFLFTVLLAFPASAAVSVNRRPSTGTRPSTTAEPSTSTSSENESSSGTTSSRPSTATRPSTVTRPSTATRPSTSTSGSETQAPVSESAPVTESASGKKTSSGTAASYSGNGYSAQAGRIEIYTTAGKVNLRSGPGKKNSIVNQVPKKNTNLGELIDAQADNAGTVWFKVRYQNKNSWITADYARAVIGDMSASDDRHVGVDSADLTDVCFSFTSEAAAHYGLEMDMGGEAYDGAVVMGGSGEFVEYIQLTGEGYALYGIEIGDTLKSVENAMKRNGLYCASKSGNVYVYLRPCQPYSMRVTEDGFDSQVEVEFDSNKRVVLIGWYTYAE